MNNKRDKDVAENRHTLANSPNSPNPTNLAATSPNLTSVSVKSTKEQILTAYNEALEKLAEKQVITPIEQNKQKEEQTIIAKTSNLLADNILTDLSNLKSKTIKQIDSLSEQILSEFQKLNDLRSTISIEQKHLQELYQINESASTLAALIQSNVSQKERFRLEAEQEKETLTQEIASQKSYWQEQRQKLEQEYKEQKEILEKTKKREAEEYNYNLELLRRKEIDDYDNKKTTLEKELTEKQETLLKREAQLAAKEQEYEALKTQLEQIPDRIKDATTNSEETLRAKLLEQFEFDSKLKAQSYEGTLKLKEQAISYLQDKITSQEEIITALSKKADIAAQQVQTIAQKALDTSVQRYSNFSTSTGAGVGAGSGTGVGMGAGSGIDTQTEGKR